jgi:hypothetical protein
MLWAGMTATHLIEPYFFDGPVNTASYAEISRGMVNAIA